MLLEILETRKGMWAKVSSRKHTPMKIFPFGPHATEVMIYGSVVYTLKDGRKADVAWAARAEMAKQGPAERWRMKFYQIYLVSHNFDECSFIILTMNRTLQHHRMQNRHLDHIKFLKI